jgi:hypothetical protein
MAQSQLYLQRASDSTKQRPLKLNRYYRVLTKTTYSEHIKLIAFTDSSLTFAPKGKPKRTILVALVELEYLDTTPLLVRQFAHVGNVMLLFVPVSLLASPFIGLFDGWDKAREAVGVSGMLAGGGLMLTSPVLLFHQYDLKKKWKILIRNNRY